MEPGWIEFEESPTPNSKGPYVSLNGDGEILMNRHVWEAIGEPEAVAMFFNPRYSRIGMRATGPHQPNAFRVIKRRRDGNHFMICTKMFLRKWDIRTKGTMRFPQPEIRDGMLVLELKTRVKVTRQYKRGGNAN